MKSVRVREAVTKDDMLGFIRLPLRLYREDHLYAPQLTRDLLVHFSRKNPFLREAEVRFFLAYHKGRIAGRIASIISHEHIALHGEKAGFFGFYECIDDRAVSSALLGAVGDTLKAQGLEIMRGPMNFSTNEECGFLIEGYEDPPMLMTPHNPPYYRDLMEEAGFEKAKDLYAYLHTVAPQLPEKVVRVAALAERKGIRARTIDMKNFGSEMLAFREVYNSAWQKNWGFLPMTVDELGYTAKRLKPLVNPRLCIIAEYKGEPVGFLGMVPDFNEVLRLMHGRITPVTLLKALWHSRKIRNLRLLLYGIKEPFRNRGVDALMFSEGFKTVKEGYRHVEFSWILEDNEPVKRIAEMFSARLYKKYRIFEKKLT